MENPMRKIKIEKIVMNMGCGTKTSLENARKVLEMITKRKVVISKNKKRSTFNVPKGNDIGCFVTIRDDCNDVLMRLIKAKENSIKASSFDNKGNFAFGIAEYIDIPGTEYDPKIGMLGLDVCVTLERPGYRIKKKKINKTIGKRHVIEKEEAIRFVSDNFGIKVI